MNQIHKVTGCRKCPLYYYEGEWATSTCNHPSIPAKWPSEQHTIERVRNTNWKTGDNWDDFETIVTPDWCPLKKEPLSLIFVQVPKDDHFWSWIGQKVRKKSNKPFKSGEKINTVKWVTTNPITGRIAFTFHEDHTSVECRMCKLIEHEAD